MSISILLADDHAIVRDGLRAILEQQEEIEIVGEASDGRSAVAQVKKLHPDIIILDVSMPELNGLDAAVQIKKQVPCTKIIILSMHKAGSQIYKALQAGVSGYLLKAAAGSEMVEAVRAVYDGERYLSQEISDIVIDGYLSYSTPDLLETPEAQLSPREREILQLVVEGKSSVEIAELLTLAPSTVDTYRSRLMQKLKINDLPSLVKFAIRSGITPLE